MPARIPNYRPSSLPTAAPQSRRDDVKFYQSARWRALRVLVLREEPICTCGLPAKHVHHIKPRKERPDLQWERSNLEALCIPCHNAKDTR